MPHLFAALLVHCIDLFWPRIGFSKVLKSSEGSEDVSTWETRVDCAHFLEG